MREAIYDKLRLLPIAIAMAAIILGVGSFVESFTSYLHGASVTCCIFAAMDILSKWAHRKWDRLVAEAARCLDD